MKELVRFDNPVRPSDDYDHIVESDGVLWYIGVRGYSVDPQYSRSGSWEDNFVSENLAKVVDGKVDYLVDITFGEEAGIRSRLRKLLA